MQWSKGAVERGPSAGEGAQPAAHVGQPVQQRGLLRGTEGGVRHGRARARLLDRRQVGAHLDA